MSPWTSPFRDEVLLPSQELLRMMDWPSSMLGSLVHEMEPEQSLGLRETDNKYQVTLAAPGIKPEDINVTVDRGILRIKGESKGDLDGWEFQNQVEKTVQLPTGSIDVEGVRQRLPRPIPADALRCARAPAAPRVRSDPQLTSVRPPTSSGDGDPRPRHSVRQHSEDGAHREPHHEDDRGEARQEGHRGQEVGAHT
jgi:HSP20 family molecular chaperone IbpA